MNKENNTIFENYINSFAKPINEEAKEEGVIDLLEQLKQEHPELEDKINLILQQAFDVVDVLKKVDQGPDEVMYAIDDALHGLIQSDY